MKHFLLSLILFSVTEKLLASDKQTTARQVDDTSLYESYLSSISTASDHENLEQTITKMELDIKDNMLQLTEQQYTSIETLIDYKYYTFDFKKKEQECFEYIANCKTILELLTFQDQCKIPALQIFLPAINKKITDLIEDMKIETILKNELEK